MKGPSASVDTNDAFHTYRIEVTTGTGAIKVFYDGVLTLEGSIFEDIGSDLIQINFGEGSGATFGTFEVEFFKHNASTVSCLDHFLCYKAKSTKGNICSSDSPSNAGGSCEVEEDCGGTEDDTDFCVPNKFPKGVQASLNDQFEDKDFVVKKPVNLCAPADKNDEGIGDPDTHLKGYLIKEVPNSCTAGAPANAKRACAIEEDCGGTTGSTSFCQKTLKHVPETNIKVRNQFHEEGKELVVDTIKPDRLLVPTAKSLTGPIGEPGPNNVDHYKCYKVKVSKGQPKFVPILGVKVDDQFTDGDKLFDLKKPTRLCNPVDKNGEGIKNDDTHLMCYQAKPAIGEPKHTPVIGIHVNNQFGAEQLDTIKEDELCVPSEKIL